MRLEEYLVLDEGVSQWVRKAQSLLGMLRNKTARAFQQTCKEHWKRLAGILEAHQLEKDALQIINRRLNSNFRSLDQVTKADVAAMSEGLLLEDFSHWWETMKSQAFPSATIFAALQICFELEKLLSKSTEANLEKMIIYGAIWAFLVSGHYIKSWMKWKKENPEEYHKEKEGKKSKGKEAKWRAKSLSAVRASKVL